MAVGKVFSALKSRLLGTANQGGTTAQPDKLSTSDRELLANMLAGMAAQIEHEQDMVKARGKEPLTVRLVPQVPVRRASAPAGWMGGGARLAPGMSWPEINGSALQLLLQLDCAQLPDDVWQGLGPRQGWLAVFLDPVSFEAKLLHFMDAGAFVPSPPVLSDCCVVGYDVRKKAEASGFQWTFPSWPLDIVSVVDGADDPREAAQSEIHHDRYKTRHDIIAENRLPFDWPTMQVMIDGALAAYERMVPTTPAERLQPEAIARLARNIAEAEQAGKTPEELAHLRVNHEEACAAARTHESARDNGPAILGRLRALKAEIDAMSANQPFSASLTTRMLESMNEMQWLHMSVPPFYRDGKKLTHVERLNEGVQVFSLPLTTHDPAARPSWVYEFETHLLGAAKSAYLSDPDILPAALVADCEQVWRNEAKHEMAGMGHVPWAYVHEFDNSDVTLLELPSGNLIGWMFGDVDNLVITVKRADLARNDFSRPVVQLTN